jgi:protein-S-isoprenylcysteine O-methyltransferase Ste14
MRMFDDTLQFVFLVGLIVLETIRYPHRMRNKRERRGKKIPGQYARVSDVTLDMLAFTGTEIIPLIYIFSPWLDFANYRLPQWTGWAGALIFGCAIGMLWRAHRDLGKNWSPSLEIVQEHSLITTGVYTRIRHPIYAAVWLAAIAQALLLHNWIAGLAGIASFLPVYLVRVPREEAMMLENFGESYREYLRRTGRIFPRLYS